MFNLFNGIEYQNPLVLNFEGVTAALFYFTLYSFFGWILENCYNLITVRKFFKPNFLWGPFKPMYGFAPVLLVFLITENTNWAMILFLCFFIPTMVEYMSGAMLQKFFHRKWWDYSHIPLHIHGHICLPFSVCWIFLSFVCLKWIHPSIVHLYNLMETFWTWSWPGIYFYFMGELMIAIRKHSSSIVSEGEPSNPN